MPRYNKSGKETHRNKRRPSPSPDTRIASKQRYSSENVMTTRRQDRNQRSKNVRGYKRGTRLNKSSGFNEGTEASQASRANRDPRPIWSLFAEDRYPLYIAAWDSESFLIQRRCQMDFTTNMGAAVDTANSQNALINPYIDAISDPSRIKDWVDAQELDFYQLIWRGAQFLFHLSQQAITRSIAKYLTTSDAGGLWDQESWDTFLAATEAMNIFLPKVCFDLAGALAVVMVMAPGYPVRNIPQAFYTPFCTSRALATMITDRATILGDVAGARIHAEKAKLPMVKVTVASILGLARVVPALSDEGIFWKMNCPYLVDDGGVQTFKDYNAAGAGTLFYDNATTDWTGAYIIFLGERPIDIWALAPLIHRHGNHAGDNDIGCLSPTDPGNDKMGFTSAAQNSTAIAEIDWPTDASLVMEYTLSLAAALQYNDGVLTDTLSLHSLLGLAGTPAQAVTGISQITWLEKFCLWVAKSLQGGVGNDQPKEEVASEKTN